MLHRISKLITAAGMAAALAVGSIPKPAAASTQSTLNTVLGAAAVIGGIILYNNYQHKRQAANNIVGYTRNGGTVYGDGRIVMPNGHAYGYTGNANGMRGNSGQVRHDNGNSVRYNTQPATQYHPQRTVQYNPQRQGNDMHGPAQRPQPADRAHQGKNDRGQHPDQKDDHHPH